MISPPHISIGLFNRIKTQEKINFARHLSIIIKAGLPMFEGLKIIRSQTTSKGLIRVIDQLISDINNGQSLAKSLRHFQDVFGDFFISIVEVGETSGTLGDNLLYLAEEMKKSKDLRGKVVSALIYPAILFVMTIAVCGFLTFFIFPKLVTAFSNLGVKLPAVTQALIAVLGFLQSYFVIIIVGAIVLFIALRLVMKLKIMRYFFHRVMLMTPVLSHLVVDVNMANLSRVLGILLKGGIKIVEALTITSQTLDNRVYRRNLVLATEGVRRGEQFARLLAAHPRLFPPLLTGMIQIGEGTGNLIENLNYLASYYSEEVDGSLKNLTAFIEPLILVFMGVIVGFVALSIVLPIYSISQGLTQ